MVALECVKEIVLKKLHYLDLGLYMKFEPVFGWLDKFNS